MRNINTKEKKGQVIPFLQDGAYYYKKGVEAYQSRNINQAAQYIRRAIRLEPEEPVFLCQLAIVLSEKGQFDEANEWLEKVINEIDDKMAECYFFLANNLAHAGDFEEAVKHLNTYLELDPKGEFAEDAKMLLEMLEDDEEDLEDVEETEEQLAHSRLERVADLLDRGQFDEAEREVTTSLSEEPKQWDLYAYLAETRFYQGDKEQALTVVADLLQKEEKNFLAQCNAAVFLKETGDETWEQLASRLKVMRPMNDWYGYHLAKTWFFLGDYDEAYDWFKRLYQRHTFSKRPRFYHQMALAAWMAGDKDRARQLWMRVTKFDHHQKKLAEWCMDQLVEDVKPKREWFYYRMPELASE
ncbi:tetratricopeptide repeat protein [Alteribacter aurantiacus]|uniref:tetratricopeptide repeat protein n=1 Tax=Alteribacter aurantiacus TaxID=254410 RepID=UPI00041C219A|nr:tetratricopeptide repeat protein [Alteribacter aurantiacus]